MSDGSGMLYVSKPQAVEAVQWRGDNSDECYRFHRPKVRIAVGELELLAGQDGAQGWVPVPVGHWLVSLPGDRSDIWPVEDAYFRGKYERPPKPAKEPVPAVRQAAEEATEQYGEALDRLERSGDGGDDG